MNAPQCTLRSPIAQPFGAAVLRGLELGVALNEFFCATPGKAHGESAVVIVTLDPHDCAHAVSRMANFAAKHGIGVAATLRGRPSKVTRG